MLRHAFATLGLARVLGGTDEPNVASRRVLEKLGMRPAGAIAGAPPAVRYLAVERDAFLASEA